MRANKLTVVVLFFLSFFSIFSLGAVNNSITPSAAKDAQMMGIIMVVDRNEIKAAQVALQKSSNPNVLAFADAMIKQHGQNLLAIRNLAQKINLMPQGSNLAANLNQQGKEDLKSLKSLKRRNFDKSYMDAMVKGHQMVLNKLNNQFIPNAKNPDLVKFLKSTRETVEHHLVMAREIDSKL